MTTVLWIATTNVPRTEQRGYPAFAAAVKSILTLMMTVFATMHARKIPIVTGSPIVKTDAPMTRKRLTSVCAAVE
jgi:hypothetical protein